MHVRTTIRVITAAAVIYGYLHGEIATAMSFEIIEGGEMNVAGQSFKWKSVLATGPIEQGDATKLAAALEQAGRDPFGNKSLLLNSEGGSVKEALKMVNVMDRYEVTAIVHSNAVCASACASILYVSAKFHTVFENGRLGFHGCKVGRSSDSAPCADAISRNAFLHGTSFAAVSQWLRDAPDSRDGVYWIGRDVACDFGLCGPPSFDYALAVPSFDCKKAALEAEVAVCNDRRLARYDASIAHHYFALKALASQEEWTDIRKSQFEWLEQRNNCGKNIDCLYKSLSGRWYKVKRFHNTLQIINTSEMLPKKGIKQNDIEFVVKLYENTDLNDVCRGDDTVYRACEFFLDYATLRRLECLEEKRSTGRGEENHMVDYIMCTERPSKEILEVR